MDQTSKPVSLGHGVLLQHGRTGVGHGQGTADARLDLGKQVFHGSVMHMPRSLTLPRSAVKPMLSGESIESVPAGMEGECVDAVTHGVVRVESWRMIVSLPRSDT